ncbi:uncharacterized protein LOC124266047 [Haliotis rubra]|uniref:uncharacterized protein LOC124266047 n=1 Tax=Haliotis rubra TaxID=36100 RepID=UPI001EE62840|nr:uncharacterized protein LOC124266047 [Haliotis rubra]
MASQADNPGSRLHNIAQTTRILINHDGPSQFVSTFAERAALKILKSYGSIFIKGNLVQVKSRIGLKLLDDISKEKGVQPLILTSYREWNLVPTAEGKKTDATPGSPKYVVMIENIFGSSNLVQTRVDEWSRLFDIMWPAVESGHIYLILTSRPDISAQCESQVKKYKLIENIQCITLDSGLYALRNGEKKKLMRMYCGKFTFSDEEIRRAIEVHGALGFPQCCKYFASSRKAKAKGIQFFFKPYEYITEEIGILQESDPLGYLVLLLVLMNGGHLANTPVRSSKKTQQIEALIGSGLCSLPSQPSSTAILTKAESLRGVYLEKIEDKFQFHHQSIFDAVFAFVSRICPDMFLGICPAKLFVEMVKTQIHCTKSNEVVVMVPRDNYGVLADRITELLLSEDSLVVLDHPALHDEEFTDVMFEKWKDEEKLMDILTFTMPYQLEIKIGQPVSNGCLFKCKFILPCMLLKQIRHLTELLTAVLTDGSPTVMLTELLACAVYANDFTSANMLLNMDVTPDESCFRALCGSPKTSDGTDEIAKHILSAVTEDMELKDMFCAAVLKDNSLVVQHLFESKLKKEGNDHTEWMVRPSLPLSQLLKKIQTTLRTSEIQKIPMTKQRGWITKIKEIQRRIETLKIIYKMMKNQGVLIQAGADVNAQTAAEQSTPLHVAVKKGSVECVKLLLRADASVDVIDSDNNTPLTCSDKTDFEIVKALVYAGIDVNYSGRSGRTCLHLALQNDDLATVRLLCDHGADVNSVETEGVTVLMMAALHGEIHMMKLLCEKGAKLDSRDAKGETVLHKAALSTIDAAEKLLYLFGFPHAPIDIEDNAGRTVLFPGVQSEDIEVIQIIRDKGLDLLKCDQDGNNALHAACKDGVKDFDTLSTLFGNSFGHINQQNNLGETVLYLLVHGKISCDFKQLLDGGANPNITSANGKTVLHVAVERGKLELVELLLQRDGDPCVADQTGTTPLHIASQSGYYKIVKLLLKHRSVPNAVNESGRTSIHLACENLYEGCVQELLKAHADPCAVDTKGLTPLHLCVGVNIGMKALQRKMLYPLTPYGKPLESLEKSSIESRNCIMKMLLVAGANPNTSDNERKCILYVASIEQSAESSVKILLEAEAVVSATDPDGRSLLHFVAENGTPEVYKLLVDRGADEYMRDHNGRTPLQIMTKKKRKSKVQNDPNLVTNIWRNMGFPVPDLQPNPLGTFANPSGFGPPRNVSACYSS